MPTDNVLEELIGKLIAIQEKDNTYLKDLALQTNYLSGKIKETNYTITILEHLNDSIV